MYKRSIYKGLIVVLGCALSGCHSWKAQKSMGYAPIVPIRGPLILPKGAKLGIPAPAPRAFGPQKGLVLTQEEAFLQIPAPHLFVPAATAPVGFYGEDEDVRQRRLKRTYEKPSKKHLFG